MTTNRGASARNIQRDRLLGQMRTAEDSRNQQEVDDALAEAKSWLRNNYTGDAAVRKAQMRLLRASPPA
jgi:hypothetical protein